MERIEAAPDTHLPDDDDRDRRGLVWFVLLLVVAVGVGGGVVWVTSQAQSELDTTAGQRDAAVGQSLGLADQVQQACVSGTLEPGDPLCARAERVQADPIPGRAGIDGVNGVDGVDGVAGRDGVDGAAGRGITGTSITSDGHLVVAYTDGAREDVGIVVGADGADGRGIVDVTIDDGRLVLTYSDSSRVDLGPVVGADGADGRGIESVGQRDGRLIVDYTDGTTQDVGPLPPGPQGERGPAGPACPAGYDPVETGSATGADGTRYARSITCVDPESAVVDEEPGTGEEPTG